MSAISSAALSRYSTTDSSRNSSLANARLGPPSLTRESTSNETSSLLPTPLDERPSRAQISPSATKSTLVHRLTPLTISRAPSNEHIEIVQSPRSEVLAKGDRSSSYFPDVQSPKTPSRRESTKALISRYESISERANSPGTPRSHKSPTRSSLVVSPPPLNCERSLPPTPTPSRPLSQLGRTPLRESFRNLMTLFGKKGKATPSSSLTGSNDIFSSVFSPRGASPSLVVIPQVTPRIEQKPPPLKSSKVLYLFKEVSENSHPVWSSCTATLFSDHILLEWLSAFGNPSQRTIGLSPSVNVQSLTWAQVDHRERMLLPSSEDSPHIFELVLDGGVTERFATQSVADRTVWVSMIW